MTHHLQQYFVGVYGNLRLSSAHLHVCVWCHVSVVVNINNTSIPPHAECWSCLNTAAITYSDTSPFCLVEYWWLCPPPTHTHSSYIFEAHLQCSTRRDRKPSFCEFTESWYMLVGQTMYQNNPPSSGSSNGILSCDSHVNKMAVKATRFWIIS